MDNFLPGSFKPSTVCCVNVSGELCGKNEVKPQCVHFMRWFYRVEYERMKEAPAANIETMRVHQKCYVSIIQLNDRLTYTCIDNDQDS